VKTDSLGSTETGVAEGKPPAREPVAFAVVPNPANGVVRIERSLPEDASVSLSMYDASGRLVFSASDLRASSFGLRTSYFPPGVYLLRLQSVLGSATRKLVVE